MRGVTDAAKPDVRGLGEPPHPSRLTDGSARQQLHPLICCAPFMVRTAPVMKAAWSEMR
jgi:hypothetical protein